MRSSSASRHTPRLASEASQCPHASDQLFLAEGLGQIEVGALLHTPLHVQRRVLAADEDDGDAATLLHLLEAAADLEAALLGEHDVEQDALREFLQCLLD